MVLLLLLAITAARVEADVARVEQEVAAAELKRAQAERDLLTRRPAPREALLRNAQDLQRAELRVKAAARSAAQSEER
jgi:hypothetical protein